MNRGAAQRSCGWSQGGTKSMFVQELSGIAGTRFCSRDTNGRVAADGVCKNNVIVGGGLQGGRTVGLFCRVDVTRKFYICSIEPQTLATLINNLAREN